MRHLHAQVSLNQGQAVEVVIEGVACNVMLLDPANYYWYQIGSAYTYYGGHFTTSPVELEAPSSGTWNLVVDTGDAPGEIEASFRVL